MSTALQGALASRRGHPLAIVEKRRQEATRGHAAGTSLRGHSMDDDIFPWLVVGVGSGWEVWDVEGRVYARSEDVHQIHAEARALKILHPRGKVRVDPGEGTEANISGPLNWIPERLAGLRFSVNFWDDAVRQYVASQEQEADSPYLIAYDLVDDRVVRLSLVMLVWDTRVTFILDPVQFLRGPQSVIEE